LAISDLFVKFVEIIKQNLNKEGVSVDECNKEELKEWILQFIKNFRKEYEKLDADEKLRIPNDGDYREPCQIEVFWLNEPIEGQILVIRHDDDRKDMEIIINGPYKDWEFLDAIEKIMAESRWAKPIPKDSRYSSAKNGSVLYSEIFANIFYNFTVIVIRNSLFCKRGVGCNGGVILGSNEWCQFIMGNIRYTDKHETINAIMTKTKSRNLAIREGIQKESASQSERTSAGCGTFFYPAICIGKIPQKTFRQRALGSYYTFPSKAFDFKFKGKTGILDTNGFIGLETTDKKEALNILNTIFGIALLSDKRCTVVREVEIGDIGILLDSLTISTINMRGSSPRTELMSITSRHSEGVETSPDELKEIIKRAEKVYQNKKIVQELIVLLEGYSHHTSYEFSQSFVTNWLIIERYLFNECEKLLDQKQIPRDKLKDKFMRSIFWSADQMLKTLNLCDKIDKEYHDLLMDLKNKRNKWVHYGEAIDEATSKKLLDVVFNIVKTDVSNYLNEQNN